MDIPTNDWGPLKAGTTYRVIQAFTDYDGGRHDVGEAWLFLGSSFLPYEDGLSLFVQAECGPMHQIRMCCRNEDQGPITASFENYLAPAD